MTERKPVGLPLPLPRFVMDEDEDLIPTKVGESGIRALEAVRRDDAIQVVVNTAADDDAAARAETLLLQVPSRGPVVEEPARPNESLTALIRIYERRATELASPPEEEQWNDVGDAAKSARRARPTRERTRRDRVEHTLLDRADAFFAPFDMKRWAAFVGLAAAISSLVTLLVTR